ncbi:MAG: Stk1 family PASTA domain-containing Ser/Thr kinase [Clostridia bacterium]|nr:Stk1 family PASTA domain-containing Ser/Thr kinase [Clostridia bacterium]
MMNSDNLAGKTIGNNRYEMLEKIGTGGMATVYKAKDTLLNRYVAIKVLRDSLEGEKGVVANFVKEAQSSASLVHNNIVSVYDVGEENGINYMVMEYVDGITLKQYIKTRGALPWQEACDFAIQIGQGINEAHSINIVHRDIKPQNILMTKDKILKVTDFGIAKAVAGETTVVGGNVLGSVHYISPEQARGGVTDARSDIYSLGIVLYEMLTGKVPFDGDTPVSVALMHLEKEPVNVKVVNLDIPSDLAYVTMKAISKDQNARYQSVSEFVEDLHAVLADEPLPSREENTPADERQQVIGGTGEEEPYIEDDYDFANEDIEEAPYEEDAYEEELPQRGRTKRKSEVKKKSRNKKKEDRVAVVLAIATVVVVGLIAFGIFMFMHASKEAKIPDFTNMTEEQAVKLAEEKGLVIAAERELSFSDTVPEHCVIEQSPKAGEVVPKRTEIKLVISIGASGGDIPTPNVVNQNVDQAIAAILEAGLTYEVVEEYSDTITQSNVIRQIPLAGTKLNRDSDAIKLFVSKGPESQAQATPAGKQVSVPSVVGLSVSEAEGRIKASGLQLGTVQRKASSSAAGTVIMQSPELGKKAIEGSYVSIVVSSGVAETTTQATQAPAQTQTQTQTQTEQQTTQSSSGSDNSGSGSGGTSTRTFTVKIPDNADDTVDVEIVMNGRTRYSGTHSKDEGSVTLDLEGSGTASVQAYIDGAKVVDKTIDFN